MYGKAMFTDSDNEIFSDKFVDYIIEIETRTASSCILIAMLAPLVFISRLFRKEKKVSILCLIRDE